MRPSGPSMVHTIEIAAEPETVWRAITDPAYTEQYFFALVPVGEDWRVGARIVYETPSGTPHMTAEVTALDEGAMLQYSVRLLRDAETVWDLPSRVTWLLEAIEGGTRLTVRHDDFEAETATFRRMGGGWPTALAGLKELLETGRATEAQSRWPDDLPRPAPMAGSSG